jgi:hypothetical protein
MMSILFVSIKAPSLNTVGSLIAVPPALQEKPVPHMTQTLRKTVAGDTKVPVIITALARRGLSAASMAPMRLYHGARSSGERAGNWVEGRCIRPLRGECESRCGSNEKRKRYAGHAASIETPIVPREKRGLGGD